MDGRGTCFNNGEGNGGDGIMKKFYYLRDGKNRPIVTICVLSHDGNMAIGFAVCAENDNPCKKIGKQIAQGRAYVALRRKRNLYPVKRVGIWSKLTTLKGYWTKPFVFTHKAQLISTKLPYLPT